MPPKSDVAGSIRAQSRLTIPSSKNCKVYRVDVRSPY